MTISKKSLLPLLVLVGFAGCTFPDAPIAPDVPTTPSSPNPPNGPSPANPQNPTGLPGAVSAQSIQFGRTVSGTITSQDGDCTFMTVYGGWNGLCDAFEFTVPANGVLRATARWVADAPLILFLKTGAGEQIDLNCCGNAPAVLQLAVDSGVTYRIELAYTGRPQGYPSVSPVEYTIETELLQLEALPRLPLQVIVLGDSGRTQRIPNVRVEVLDGPLAGTTALFDNANGWYEFASLPVGFVNVLVSADRFIPASVRLPVGANLARELVLQRREEVPSATHTLYGMVWGRPSNSTAQFVAYPYVRIEILDGPLAGMFTYTDDMMGFYWFKGLPPGPVQIRALAAWMPSQTLSAVVEGITNLSFFVETPR